jgi:ubiquinone/menaquinone biosynthesis C-methylase UbiE
MIAENRLKLGYLRHQLTRFLRHVPPVYHFAAKVYGTVSNYINSRTWMKERYWARRKKFAESYWNNREHPSKKFLGERIAAFAPIHSILEVGCASGPNLWLLAKRFPEAEIVGIDINPEAVKFGNDQFTKEGILNVKLSVGKADELGQFRDKAFDIVFTNALLIYVGPDKIKGVIQQMFRLTRRALVLMECHCLEPNKDPKGEGFRVGANWIRDYQALLRQFIPEEQIRITKIPKEVLSGDPWETFGAVIEVVIEKVK